MSSISHSSLHAALKTHFGFTAFRPGQEAVVRDALAGRDLLAVMPTGGGKSLCFQLPALIGKGVMVVVSPLIALMQDQVRLLENSGIAATFLNSTLPAAEGRKRMEGLLQGAYKLLYLAPERLLMPEFLDGFLPRLMTEQGITAFTLDEAHCVSEWGHDFRPEYRQLSRLRQAFPEVPVLAFTATATERVRADIIQQLALQAPAVHIASFDRPNLFYAVKPKGPKSYLELLAMARAGGSGIVYCLSRARVEKLADKLSDDGIKALPYHAGLDANARRDNQERFIRDDAQVMVATVAFGMGINKPDVRWVLHYDLPKTLEGYYQEAGRAGRDGEPARCTLFFGAGDIATANFLIAQKLHPDTGEPLLEEQAAAKKQLRQVVDYAETCACRRSAQLRYFGEEFPGPCAACDNCLNPRERVDETQAAQMLLSTVARLAKLGQRFGAGHALDILMAKESDKVLRFGHQSLSTWGLGAGRPLADWRGIVAALKRQQLLDEVGEPYPVLALNAESWQLLRGNRSFSVAPAAKAERPGKPDFKRQTSAGKSPAMGASSASGEAVFQALRALRKELADAQGIAPYMVFADTALRAMSEALPGNLAAFARIPGVGAAKLDKYGERFVALILQQSASSPGQLRGDVRQDSPNR